MYPVFRKRVDRNTIFETMFETIQDNVMENVERVKVAALNVRCCMNEE